MNENDLPTGLRWNDFQKLNRRRGWSQQQMSEQWRAYKASNASCKESKAQITLQQWLSQLGTRNNRRSMHNPPEQDSNRDQNKPPDATAHSPIEQPQVVLRQQDPCVTTPALSGLDLVISPLTPSSSSSQANHNSQQQSFMNSPEAPTQGTSWLHQQQRHSIRHPSPTPSPCSSKQSPVIPTHELAKLRAAVRHLMTGQTGLEQSMQDSTAQPDSICSAQLHSTAHCDTTASAQQLDHHSGAEHHLRQQQHQQQQQQVGKGRASSEAAVGCFGFAAAGGLNWNSFQRACKGRGLTKAELSAAWKQYKLHGTMPDWWQDNCHHHQQQLQDMGASRLPEQQQQQQDQEPHQNHGKWGTIKQWVQSRASSLAVSRAVSRAVSPAQTPQHSPSTAKPVQQQFHSAAAAVAVQSYLAPDSQAHQDDARRQQEQELLSWHTQEVAEAQQQQKQPWPQRVSIQLQQEPPTCWAVSSQPRAVGDNTVAAADAAVEVDSATGQQPAAACLITSNNISSRASSTTATPLKEHRQVRELVPHNSPGLLDHFSDWVLVELQPAKLKQVKLAIPARPGLYEWGVRLPVGITTADLAAAEAVAAARGKREGVKTRSVLQIGQHQLSLQGQSHVSATEYGPVVCFYLGKAGILSGGRKNKPRSAAAAAAATAVHRDLAVAETAPAASTAPGPGETLRTRFNKYALTKAGRLGPIAEPHKDALFEQLQAAGGLLYYRWCVAVNLQPIDMERQLLSQLDYAANVVNNGRRRLVLVPALQQPTSSKAQQLQQRAQP